MAEEATRSARAEAVLVRGAALDALDAVLAPLIVALAAASVDIAVAGAEDTRLVAQRFHTSGLGRIVVADTDRALLVGSAGREPTIVWKRGTEPFVEWWRRLQWRSGIHAGAIATAEAGGDDITDIREILEAQLRLRSECALPASVATPGWVLRVDSGLQDGSPRAHPSLLALSDGTTSAIGGLDGDSSSGPEFGLVAGAYGLGHDGLVRPLPGPVWTRLDPPVESNGSGSRCLLDLRTGTLVIRHPGTDLSAFRFVSLTRPGIGVLRGDRAGPATWPAPLSRPHAPSALSADYRYATGTAGGGDDHVVVWADTSSDRAAITVAATQRVEELPGRGRIERLTATRSGRSTARTDASAALAEARFDGFDRLLCEHRRAWSERWAHADIEIEGDPEAQLAIRFALFHLLSSAACRGEAPVGARGLTGLAYAGHVFWDTDVFVLPVLAATLPEAARAVLEYRVRRLGAARLEASQRRLPGARFPWESADSGRDVTPTSMRDVEGRIVPIRTGELEEHINSDVAWAAQHYVDWTGDAEFLLGDGRRLVTETAQFLMARIRTDGGGRGHLDGVIGPDEYHELVDDNAYTNLMARWHLRRAAELVADGANSADANRFVTSAGSLVDGFDESTGRYEQFAGFWDLEPLLARDVADPPVAADLLLGRDRVERSQVIKQPDVLMAHHLIPDECRPRSLAADLDFYLPRTAHGSSLSPAICAAVLAQAGRPDEAMPLFDLAARIDLDDLTRSTTGGLHLATMGGLWQATVFGFAGIRPRADALHIDPHLPTRWTSLHVNLRYQGEPVAVTIDHDAVRVDAPRSVPISVADRVPTAPGRRVGAGSSP